MILTIQKRELDNGVRVIEIGGRVSLGRESGRIEPEITGAISAGVKTIIVDLSKVTHIDSTGIGIIAYGFGKATQANVDFRISGAKPNVLDVFRITRLHHVIPFFPDIDSAIQGNGRLS